VPSVVVNPKHVRAFESEAAFEAWLVKNHDRAEEVWIKIFKKASGKPTISASQAIDVALCWGWIDGIRKGLDDEAFLQRYTPRRGKSRWSQINVERVRVLTKAGRMTAHGQKHIDSAKSDGRWDAAYAPPSATELPADFMAAIAKKPKAKKTLAALGRQVTFGMAYRLHHLKTASKRAERIAQMIELLDSGQSPVVVPTARKKAP
jgi:uncharacterized protein YdeI (YjbR/CyaY-like superfamily)